MVCPIGSGLAKPGLSMSLGRTFPSPHIRLIWTDGQASNHNNSWHDCCVNPSCLARDPGVLDGNYINVVPHADQWLAATKPPCSTCRANCCSFFPRLLSPDKCEGGLTRRRATLARVKSTVNYFYESPVLPLELICRFGLHVSPQSLKSFWNKSQNMTVIWIVADAHFCIVWCREAGSCTFCPPLPGKINITQVIETVETYLCQTECPSESVLIYQLLRSLRLCQGTTPLSSRDPQIPGHRTKSFNLEGPVCTFTLSAVLPKNIGHFAQCGLHESDRTNAETLPWGFKF